MSSDTSAEDQAEQDAAADNGGGGKHSAGLPDPDDVDTEEVKEIEAEREERLDPDNRPDNAEVDNTGREFDDAKGQFTDHEDHGLGPFTDPQ